MLKLGHLKSDTFGRVDGLKHAVKWLQHVI